MATPVERLRRLLEEEEQDPQDVSRPRVITAPPTVQTPIGVVDPDGVLRRSPLQQAVPPTAAPPPIVSAPVSLQTRQALIEAGAESIRAGNEERQTLVERGARQITRRREDQALVDQSAAAGKARSLLGAFTTGFGGVVAGVPEALEELLTVPFEAFGGNIDTPAEDRPGRRMGESLRRATRGPINPEFQDDFSIALSSGAGSLVGFAAGVFLGRGGGLFRGANVARQAGLTGSAAQQISLATGRQFGTIAAGVLGSLSQGAEAVRDAERHNATANQVFGAFVGGLGLGATEALPFAAVLHRLDKGTGGLVKRWVQKGAAKAIAVQGLSGALEEAIQEFIQNAGTNAIAKALFDADREILDAGVAEGSAVGGILGFTMNALFTALGGRAARRQAGGLDIPPGGPAEQAEAAASGGPPLTPPPGGAAARPVEEAVEADTLFGAEQPVELEVEAEAATNIEPGPAAVLAQRKKDLEHDLERAKGNANPIAAIAINAELRRVNAEISGGKPTRRTRKENAVLARTPLTSDTADIVIRKLGGLDTDIESDWAGRFAETDLGKPLNILGVMKPSLDKPGSGLTLDDIATTFFELGFIPRADGALVGPILERLLEGETVRNPLSPTTEAELEAEAEQHQKDLEDQAEAAGETGEPKSIQQLMEQLEALDEGAAEQVSKLDLSDSQLAAVLQDRIRQLEPTQGELDVEPTTKTEPGTEPAGVAEAEREPVGTEPEAESATGAAIDEPTGEPATEPTTGEPSETGDVTSLTDVLDQKEKDAIAAIEADAAASSEGLETKKIGGTNLSRADGARIFLTKDMVGRFSHLEMQRFAAQLGISGEGTPQELGERLREEVPRAILAERGMTMEELRAKLKPILDAQTGNQDEEDAAAAAAELEGQPGADIVDIGGAAQKPTAEVKERLAASIEAFNALGGKDLAAQVREQQKAFEPEARKIAETHLGAFLKRFPDLTNKEIIKKVGIGGGSDGISFGTSAASVLGELLKQGQISVEKVGDTEVGFVFSQNELLNSLRSELKHPPGSGVGDAEDATAGEETAEDEDTKAEDIADLSDDELDDLLDEVSDEISEEAEEETTTEETTEDKGETVEVEAVAAPVVLSELFDFAEKVIAAETNVRPDQREATVRALKTAREGDTETLTTLLLLNKSQVLGLDQFETFADFVADQTESQQFALENVKVAIAARLKSLDKVTNAEEIRILLRRGTVSSPPSTGQLGGIEYGKIYQYPELANKLFENLKAKGGKDKVQGELGLLAKLYDKAGFIESAEQHRQRIGKMTKADVKKLRAADVKIRRAKIKQQIAEAKGEDKPDSQEVLDQRKAEDEAKAVVNATTDVRKSILDSPDKLRRLTGLSQEDFTKQARPLVDEYLQAEQREALATGDDTRLTGLDAVASDDFLDDLFFASLRVEVEKRADRETRDGKKKKKADGERGKKFGSTGEGLRRFWEQQSKLAGDADSTTAERFAADLSRATARADLFPVERLSKGGTPGLKRYLELLRQYITPYKQWAKENGSFISGYLTFDHSIARLIKNEDQVKIVKEEAVAYIKTVTDLAQALEGATTIKEASEFMLAALVDNGVADSSTELGRRVKELQGNSTYLHSMNASTYTAEEAKRFTRATEGQVKSSRIRLLVEEEALPDEEAKGTRAKAMRRPKLRIEDLNRENRDDVRKGKDVEPAQLKTEFGFADITIGGYVTSKQERLHANGSFEAFHDLAKIVGIKPTDVSMGGELHYSIGALGHGRHSAHYAPSQAGPGGVGNVQVINVTNTKGDGSVAHEWGHALDYNLRSNLTFYGQHEVIGEIVSQLSWDFDVSQTEKDIVPTLNSLLKGDSRYQGMKRKPPIEHARYYLDILIRQLTSGSGNHLRRSSYYKEARRSGNEKYWGNKEEMFARAWESWIFDQLVSDNNSSSEYLVTEWVSDGFTKNPPYKFSPYPAGDERVRFAGLFEILRDNLVMTADGPTLKKGTLEKLREYKAPLLKRLKELKANLEAFDAERKEIEQDKIRKRQEELRAEEQKKAEETQAAIDDALGGETSTDADIKAEDLGTLSDEELDDLLDDVSAEGEEADADQNHTESIEEKLGPPADSDDAKYNGEPDPIIVGTEKLVKRLQQVFNRVFPFQKLTNPAFFKLADEAFGGTRGEGTYTTKDAYDAMELAVNINLRKLFETADVDYADAAEWVPFLNDFTATLPTQTNRTEEQVKFQQFSTPPPLAYIVGWVANLNRFDQVLEPSAGMGALVVQAQSQGAGVIVNELNLRRNTLLAQLGVEPKSLDAQFINSHIKGKEAPSVVLMNPPFSAAPDRGSKNKTARGAKHVENALKTLRPGGRLVAIVGKGMERGKPAFKKWWNKIDGQYNVRAAVRISGREYRKFGTTFDSVILVIDKPATPVVAPPTSAKKIVTGKVESVLDLVPLLEGIRDGRLTLSEPTPRQQAIEAGDIEVGGEDRTDDGSRPPTDQPDVGERGPRPDEPGTGPTTEGDGVPTKRPDKPGTDDGVPGPTGTGTDSKPKDSPTTEGSEGEGPSASTDTAPTNVGVGSELSIGELTTKLKQEGIAVADETLKGLVDIFGGNTLKSFPAGFDEEAYQRAKPHFQEALKNAIAAGQTLKDLFRALVRAFGDGIKPYLKRFAQDLREPELTDDVYELYAVKNAFKGSQPHPGDLVETATMAEVEIPDTNYKADLPQDLVESGQISDAQIDPVVLAGHTHSQMLPSDRLDNKEIRRGILIGDGTGVGKTRELLGIVLDNIAKGRKKIIYISKNQDLINDLKENWEKMLQNPDFIFALGKGNHQNVKNNITATEGIVFTSYATLGRSLAESEKGGTTEFTVGRRVKERDTREGGGVVTTTGVLKTGDRVRHTVAPLTGVVIAEKEDGTITIRWDQTGSEPVITPSLLAGGGLAWAGRTIPGATGVVQKTSASKKVSVLFDGQKKPRFVPAENLQALGEKTEIERTRNQQLKEWVGEDFDGLIIFDEAHQMANAISIAGTRGASKPSDQARAGLQLADALPGARVVYATATAATEVTNLAYMDRLGLWGRGTAFADKRDFITKIQEGGVAAMEMIARDMKALGVYMARTISFKGVGYDRITHNLTRSQTLVYNELVRGWQTVLSNIEAALADDMTGAGGNSRVRTDLKSLIWNFQQRFFNQIITSMKMPSIIEDAKKRLAEGHSVVFQLVLTNEEQQKRGIAKMLREGLSIDELDLSPKEDFMDLVRRAFPVQQYVEDTDADGNAIMVPVTHIDEDTGNEVPTLNPEAVEMRDQLLQNLNDIRVPTGPLDLIIEEFGHQAVAEVTGRKKRTIRNAEGELELQQKPNNENEIAEFQSGKKRILVFSDAGGTGKSYHADLEKENQDLRYHYLIQGGWQAAKAVQGFGRTHRSNQRQPPVLILTSTNLDAEMRFISSIAKRLDQLGALTKGNRETGGQGLFSAEDNLETPYAETAINDMFRAILNGQIEGITADNLKTEMGLDDLQDPQTNEINEAKLPVVKTFLNRLLSTTTDRMPLYYSEFFSRLKTITEAAKASGEFDAGLENLVAKTIENVHEEVVFTEPRSGAETRYVKLELTDPVRYNTFQNVIEMGVNASRALLFFGRNNSSGKLYAFFEAPDFTEASGNVRRRYRRMGVSGAGQMVNQSDHRTQEVQFRKPNTTELTVAEAKAAWPVEIEAAPKSRTWNEHIITGAILPIWDRVIGKPRLYRVITKEGKRMIGRVIAQRDLTATLNNLNAEGSKIKTSHRKMMERILDSGFVYRLSNRWRIKAAMVNGEKRIELVGPGFGETEQVKSDGVFTEIIKSSTRYFIPTKRAEGIKVLAKLLEFREVVDEVSPTIVEEKRTGTYQMRNDGNAEARMMGEELHKINANAAAAQVQRSPEIETLATAINTDFLQDQTTSLIGKKVNTVEDLATLSQVYRDPRYETLRYFLTNDAGQVLYQTAVSARMPGATGAFATGQNVSDLGADIRKTTGAKHLWMVHNHPSGVSEPSASDMETTREIAEDLIALGINVTVDHVVINSNEYSVMQTIRDGDRVRITLESRIKRNYGRDRLLEPALPHPTLGKTMTGPADVSDVAMALHKGAGWITVVGLNPAGDVRSIGEVHETILSDTKALKEQLRKFAQSTGATDLFIFGVNSNRMFKGRKFDARAPFSDRKAAAWARDLVELGFVKDIIGIDRQSLTLRDFSVIVPIDVQLGLDVAEATKVLRERKTGTYESDVTRQQEKIVENVRKGQPLDRLMRTMLTAPFKLFGIDILNERDELKVGVVALNRIKKVLIEAKFSDTNAFRWMNPYLEHARHGLIDRYGVDPNLIQRGFEMTADRRALQLKGAEYVDRLMEAGMGTLQEAIVVHKMLTGEDLDGNEALITKDEWEGLTDEIRQGVDELGLEAVALNLISRESYERNHGTYLHRVYTEHELGKDQTLSRFLGRLMAGKGHGIQGQALKGRGIFQEVTQERLLRDISKPDSEEFFGIKKRRGKPDESLLTKKFRILDLFDEGPGVGSQTLPGIEDAPTPHKLKRRMIIPADAPVPARLGNYEDRGVFEIRRIVGNKLVLWRDFTKPERVQMGEILDARYTIAKTYAVFAQDIASARFYRDIAKNEEWTWKKGETPPDDLIAPNESALRHYIGYEWVKVPVKVIPKTGGKTKWGDLSGRYVRAEVWKDLSELDAMNQKSAWQWLLKQWKLNKTARNPVVHANNVMANLGLMDLIDIRARDLWRGIKEYRARGELYELARVHGGFGSDFISQEIQTNILDPVLKEMDKEAAKGLYDEGTFLNKLRFVDRYSRMASEGIQRLGKAIKSFDRASREWYVAEDEVFRMAIFIRKLELGYDPHEAAGLAREQMLNYDIRAPWVNKARRSVLPFLAYTYRAVPAIADAMFRRPWKMAKYALIAEVANAFAYAVTDGDEEWERASLRPEVRGSTWIAGAPRMMRMPVNDKHGNPIFLDIRRWIPAGDVFDIAPNNPLPIPAWMQFGGPIMIAGELFLNRSAFTGQDIVDPLIDTLGDKTKKYGEFLYRSLAPSAPWIYDSWYWNKIARAATGGRDALGRDFSVPEALLSSIGVKAKGHDVELNYDYRRREFDRTERALKYSLRLNERDLAQGLIKSKEHRKIQTDLLDKMKRLNENRVKQFSPLINRRP